MTTRWIDETLYPSWGQRLRVDKVLFEDKTEHQHLVIFENASHGRVMIAETFIPALIPRLLPRRRVPRVPARSARIASEWKSIRFPT